LGQLGGKDDKFQVDKFIKERLVPEEGGRHTLPAI
jgi:hypothetical protein